MVGKMSKKKRKKDSHYEDFAIDLRDCQFLGEGHNGFVYLLPDNKVIKIFKKPKNCKKEYYILKRVRGSPHFPVVYESMGNYIIRDFVGGICLKDYLKTHEFSRRLAVNLINLLQDFKKNGFKKIDTRCKDIYVQEDEFLMVIDPKYSYTREKDFPKHLAKGLKKLKVLDKFMEFVKEEKPHLYEKWSVKLRKAGLL